MGEVVREAATIGCYKAIPFGGDLHYGVLIRRELWFPTLSALKLRKGWGIDISKTCGEFGLLGPRHLRLG